MQQFELNEQSFSYILYEDFDESILPGAKKYKKGSEFLDIGTAFDIETTRYNQEKLSFMYVWQFAIADITIIGRKWDDFIELLGRLQEFYQLNPQNNKMMCLVHNLSFEFQFFKKWIDWSINEYGQHEIFATEERKIIKALSIYGIEFRDSLILTQCKLEDVPKTFGLKHQKLVGDLDYSLIRTSETPLTNEELAYCINDVQILTELYQVYIRKNFVVKEYKIPMTSTGVIREEMKRNFKKLDKGEKKAYQNKIIRCFPDEEQYSILIKWVYRGGFTHANAHLANMCFSYFENMMSRDIKSSYPASMLHNKFPFKFKRYKTGWFYKFKDDKKILNEYAFYGTFIFKNIRAKGNHSIESKNKLLSHSNKAIFDNGRLLSDRIGIKVCLTEQDWLNYQDFYLWDEVKCIDLFVSKKEELPNFFKDLILKYYYEKETFDSSDEEQNRLRNLSKRKVNGLYGMTVTSLFHDRFDFDEKLGVMIEQNLDTSFFKTVSKQLLICYIGIWTSAYSRRALLKMFKKVGNNAIYGDTDSIKYMNYEKYEYIFNDYNARMERINNSMYVGEYPRGVFKDLGNFEKEYKHRIFRLKSLGAKRYIYTTIDEKDGKIKLNNHVVVAGMRKGSLEKYCKENDVDMYDAFDDNLEIKEELADKLGASYCDDSFTYSVVDYQGKPYQGLELSCVTLVPIKFTLNMKDDYLSLIERLKKKDKMSYGGARRR